MVWYGILEFNVPLDKEHQYGHKSFAKTRSAADADKPARRVQKLIKVTKPSSTP